jgi:uncharacterized protein (DUF1499 family)
MRTLYRNLVFGAIVPIAAVEVLWIVNALVPRPKGLGLRNGRLAACPNRPNCVSSQADDPEHSILPMHFKGTLNEAKERLRGVVAAWPRTRLIDQQTNYLQFEFVTPVGRFVDDVEFLFLEQDKIVHVRSASRLGYSDLGKNRKRVELIRQQIGWE